MELTFNQFEEKIKDVIKNPRPFMCARFGDGEGIVMGYPENTSQVRAMQRWGKWLGPNSIDIKEFGKKIRDAVKACDMIGTPCQRHQSVNNDWRNVKQYMNQYGLIGGRDTFCMDFTVWLHTKGLMKEVFGSLKKLHCISCRDVGKQLGKLLNLDCVETTILPLQHRPCTGENKSQFDTHYPSAYIILDDMINKINDIKNEIFFVGAGGLGKIYCQWIKERGGIAIDMGSMFDGWDGLVTRSYLKDIDKYRLD